MTQSPRPVPSVGYLVWRLAVKWRAGLDRALTPVGLTSAQYALLASLSELSSRGARPSQRELADFSGLAPMFVSKLVRALERNGLVTRDSRPADSRAVALTLTKRGAEAVRQGRAIVVELEQRRLAVLGERRADLAQALMTLLEHTDAIEGKDRQA
jgi:DNA-binding MarR family transcriptional regulator